MTWGMTDAEAVEYFEFNTIGSWMGEGTPIFIVSGVKPLPFRVGGCKSHSEK